MKENYVTVHPYDRPGARFKRWLRNVLGELWAGIQFLIAAALVISVSVALVVGLSNTFGPLTCDASAGNIGHPHSWGFWEGCQIEVEPGIWVPLKNYSYVDGVTE